MRWIGTLAAAMVVALGLVAAVPQPACACRCAATSVREDFERADAVFVGTLVSRAVQGNRLRLVFEVSAVYKGKVSRRQEIVTNASGAACGLDVEFRGTGAHLLFGHSDQAGDETAPGEIRYWSSLCGGSRAFDAPTRAALELLAKASKPATAGPAPARAREQGGLPAGLWLGAGGAGAVGVAAVAVLLWRRRPARQAGSLTQRCVQRSRAGPHA